MKVLNKERAAACSRLLPDFVRDSIPEEEKEWKEQIFTNLEKAIKEDKPEDIDFWFSSFDVYVNSDVFTLTLEEIEKLLKLFYDFITTSDHWKLVSQACQAFLSIARPLKMDFKLKLPWRPLFTLVQKLVLSRSKTKRLQPPTTLFANLNEVIRVCTLFFEDSATKEMLDEWLPLFEPHHHSFVLAHSLICLFLPVDNQYKNLWFDKFFSLWPMFHAEAWDFQWLNLFSRLSQVDCSDVDWDPYLPFLFNILGRYLSIPINTIGRYFSILFSDCQLDISISDYQTDMYNFFFIGITSCVALLPLFSEILVNLLTSKSKEKVRKLLETLFFLLKPYCSPLFAQTGEGTTPELAIVFINIFMHTYLKRVSTERKTEFHRLQKLQQEDHEWFTRLLLPIIQLEEFCSDSRINSLKDFCSLVPNVAIQEMLNTASEVIEYERLQSSAVKIIISLIPICVYYDIGVFLLRDFTRKFAEILNVLDIEQSIGIFSLFMVYLSCNGFKEEDYDINLSVVKKAIDFVEGLTEPDYEQYGDLPNSWIAICCSNCTPQFTKDVVSYFKDKIKTLRPCVISDVVRTIGIGGIQYFIPKAFDAQNKEEFAILKGILRVNNSKVIIENEEKIVEAILRGINTDDKKIQETAAQCLKISLYNLLQTTPVLQQPNGFTTLKDATMEWNVPGEEQFQCADRICKVIIKNAEEKLASTDITVQLVGMSLLSNLAKGIKYVISNKMFDVIDREDLPKQPKITRIECELLKPHWEYMLTKLSSLLDEKTPEKLINATLKTLPVLLIPRDHIHIDANEEKMRINSMKELLAIGITSDAIAYRLVIRSVIRMYSFRNAVMLTPYTKQVESIIKKTTIFSTHPSNKIRNRCALFVQETSAAFPTYFGPYFETLIETTEKCINDKNKLSGLAQSLCSCCQLVFTADTFSTIAKVALLVCRTVSNDIPEDSVRSLKQFIIMTFDIVDLNEKRFAKEEFLSIRRHIINTAIKRYEEEGQDREVESYSTALVISMAQNRPELLSLELFNFLISKLESEAPNLREVIMQALPVFIELLIPRVPRRKRVEVEKITPENYDSVQFKDRFLKGLSVTEPEFLSIEQLVDEEVIGKYFKDVENRVAIHKFLINYFIETKETIANICKGLVDAQVHQEEFYSKMHVQFWVSMIRLLGTPFIFKLIEVMENLTKPNANVAMHVIAAELFSSVLFALKRWKYSEIQKILPALIPFITRVVREGESDFQSIWFISIVCGVSDHDPRRFMWLFDKLIECIPEHITQIRDVKAASLVVDILLEFSWRIPTLITPIIQKAILPMFEEKAQQFEQIRECSIRAVSSLFSAFFNIKDSSIPKEVQDLFDNVLSKAGPSFTVSWLTAQFTTQALSSFVVNRLVINKIADWLDISIGNTEDDKQRARCCLMYLIRSNWLWTCSEKPLTKESALPIIQKVFGQLSIENRQWQDQAVILFLTSAFYEQNYFFIGDEEVENLVNKVVKPALESSNNFVQESATEVFIFLLKSSEFLRQKIPQYLEYYGRLIYSGETPANKIGGVKGLVAIIHSTLLFGTIPNYVIEAFEKLRDEQSSKLLEPYISQAFKDFWAIYDQNLTQDVVEQLAPYRETVRRDYFC